jgi:hypothetical protein
VIADLRHQWPAIGATLALLRARGQAPVEAPGPWLEEEVAPRPRALVARYRELVGAAPEGAPGELPPHLFPQWGWPLLTRCLHGLPYDLTRVVNAGCTWTRHAPLPDDQPLRLRARLERVDDDGRRALFFAHLWTGTQDTPDALSCTLTVFCPLKRPAGEEGAPRPRADKPRVPLDAAEIGRARLDGGLGWRFATLTGDLNPIHWVGPYARMMGFPGVILHGFCTAALAAEQVIAGPLGGDARALRGLEARFPQSLRLPAEVGVYLGPVGEGPRALHVGLAPGAPAFLVGAAHV